MLSPTVSLARERCFLSRPAIYGHLQPSMYYIIQVCSMRWRGFAFTWLGSGLRDSIGRQPPCVPSALKPCRTDAGQSCTSLRSGDDCGGNREKTQWLKEVHNSLQTPLPMDPPY
ncbi:hypothetical protein GBAR_LOCUS18513 [Geodia barretti]|uniref:Uncharacterized protein n=1 Tax=Geodia barretti TaxID=519541 RepID=A0AA35SP98_GEOBA|nr:hypothetical protein GBAR_LOCUS18513 [Geodia barretti]